MSPPAQQKRKKRPKKSPSDSMAKRDHSPANPSPSLMNQDMLSQLMAKMDDQPMSSAAAPFNPTPPLHTSRTPPPAPASPLTVPRTPPLAPASPLTVPTTPQRAQTPPSSPYDTTTEPLELAAAHETAVHVTAEKRRRKRRRRQPKLDQEESLASTSPLELDGGVPETEDPLPAMRDTLTSSSPGIGIVVVVLLLLLLLSFHIQ